MAANRISFDKRDAQIIRKALKAQSAVSGVEPVQEDFKRIDGKIDSYLKAQRELAKDAKPKAKAKTAGA